MDEIIQSIYSDPESWSAAKHTFNHKSGFKLWIANGFWYARPYEVGIYITFIQKYKLWQAYKWWCLNAPINAIVKGRL